MSKPRWESNRENNGAAGTLSRPSACRPGDLGLTPVAYLEVGRERRGGGKVSRCMCITKRKLFVLRPLCQRVLPHSLRCSLTSCLCFNLLLHLFPPPSVCLIFHWPAVLPSLPPHLSQQALLIPLNLQPHCKPIWLPEQSSKLRYRRRSQRERHPKEFRRRRQRQRLQTECDGKQLNRLIKSERVGFLVGRCETPTSKRS